MTHIETRRERYLKDTFPKRVGALAANLARLSSFSKETSNPKIIEGLLEESEHFIEWTAADAPEDLRARLVELQIQLALYSYRLKQGRNECLELSKEFKKWSDGLLVASGLVR